MAHAVSVKVPFQTTNVTKCMCPKCPVQSKSKCASGKLSTLKDALKNNPLKREDIPTVYCSTGKADCRDLDTKQPCICGSCAVFDHYKLAGFQPVGYYCRDGNAK